MKKADFKALRTWKVASWEEWKLCEGMTFWIGYTDIGDWITWLNKPAATDKSTSDRFDSAMVGAVSKGLCRHKKLFAQ